METEPEYDLAGAGDITNFAHHAHYEEEPEEFQSNVAHDRVVVSFIEYFHTQLTRANVAEIQQCYESVFSKLSERFFKGTTWPAAAEIADYVNNDPIFLMLYNELYFRHVYSKLTPTLAQRIDSFENYRKLFAAIAAAAPVAEGEGLSFATLELPYQWLWDMVDEFIYQFQSFCQFRIKTKGRSAEESAELAKREEVWDVMATLSTLQALVSSSNVNKWLDDEKASGKLASEVKRVPMLVMLGYFSLIGMLRVHCLLGDYHTGLKELQHLDFHRKAPLFTRVAACHITVYYFMGFSYLMLRRYADAIRAFSHILMYIHRTKQYHNRSYQFDQISRKNEQMYALLAICIGLCPQRLDEQVQTNLREKHSDRLAKLSKGEDSALVFEELFTYACPKFVNVAPVGSDSAPQSNDAHKLQLAIFLTDVQEQEKHPFIRSYLKLYTTIPVAKLGAFVAMNPTDLRRLLLSLKHKTRSHVRALTDAPLGGRTGLNTDVDFTLEGEMVHVADSKPAVPYGEFFIRHITKFEEIIADFQR